MATVPEVFPKHEEPPSGASRLESWKQIADYLKRSDRTVRRWEAEEGLPVHRHVHQNAGTVYAFPTELDSWLVSRRDQHSVAASTTELTVQTPVITTNGLFRRTALAAASLSLVAFLIYTEAWRIRFDGSDVSAIRSLAVLPLANLTGDPGQAYLAEGLTDALITELAQSTGVRVIARTSVLQYRDTQTSLPEIARELNVEGIVEGAVARSGSQVRITAQLIDARTERHVWARSYERDPNDLVSVQRDISEAITGAVRGTFESRPSAPSIVSRRINAEAYHLFVQALVAAGGSRGFADAIMYCRQAIAKQPDFAEAYARMALYLLQSSFGGTVSPAQFLPQAEAAARKAVELDDRLAEAHAVFGEVLYHQWEWAGSERELRRALALNPSDVDAHRVLSGLLSALGRYEEALAEAELIRGLDPQSFEVLGRAYRSAGQHDRAVAEFRKAVQHYPNRPPAHFQLGQTYVQKGMLNEGIVELEAAIKLSPDNRRFRGCLAYAYALSGREAEARKIVDDLVTLARSEYVPPTAIARIYLALEDKTAVHAWLEKAYQDRDFDLVATVADTGLVNLRSDRQYEAIFARPGLAR